MGGVLPRPPHGNGTSGAITGALGLFYSEESQKESQEDQGEVKELGGTPPSCFKVPYSSWLSCWLFQRTPSSLPSSSSLGSLELTQIIAN